MNKRMRVLLISVIVLTSPTWIGAIVAGLAWVYTKLN